MVKRVLITGGAGFIGSHLADELLESGYEVRILDNCIPQVHGAADGGRPSYLSPDAELMIGDIRDPERVRKALRGIDGVFHLAAMVGVGQSMYQIADYVGVNDLGTATLLQALSERPVKKLVVASSMSIYGEGMCRNAAGEILEVPERSSAQLRAGQWEPRDEAGDELEPVGTPESKRPALTSIYALGKYAQERMSLLVGQAYGIETVALRFFNVYGTRQALSNPYTGVLAIFASRLLNRRRPLVFEDGRQRRDFVHVRDVARACRMALETPEAAGLALNVGSGRSFTVAEVGRRLATTLGVPELTPQITGRYRVGDIRHCFADASLTREVLGFAAEIPFDDGLGELVDWLAGEVAVDQVDQATDELAKRGLVA